MEKEISCCEDATHISENVDLKPDGYMLEILRTIYRGPTSEDDIRDNFGEGGICIVKQFEGCGYVSNISKNKCNLYRTTKKAKDYIENETLAHYGMTRSSGDEKVETGSHFGKIEVHFCTPRKASSTP